MPKGYVRKKCADCKATSQGRSGKTEWCDHCGGEMRAIPYGARRRRNARR